MLYLIYFYLAKYKKIGKRVRLSSLKLTFNNVNYLKKELKEDKKDKQELLGLVGTLDEEELQTLLYEVLNPIGYNLMVTPKEIDFVIKKLSSVISESINNSIHDIDKD